jgi:hypothetical protein
MEALRDGEAASGEAEWLSTDDEPEHVQVARALSPKTWQKMHGSHYDL